MFKDLIASFIKFWNTPINAKTKKKPYNRNTDCKHKYGTPYHLMCDQCQIDDNYFN